RTNRTPEACLRAELLRDSQRSSPDDRPDPAERTVAPERPGDLQSIEHDPARCMTATTPVRQPAVMRDSRRLEQASLGSRPRFLRQYAPTRRSVWDCDSILTGPLWPLSSTPLPPFPAMRRSKK